MPEVFLNVHIQPRASKDEICGEHGGRIKIRTIAPPVDGKANDHLIGFLSSVFGVPRRQIQLVAGETGRLKRFRVLDPVVWPPEIEAILGPKPQ
jgi:uncharacterized protein (TIGR00251 family)